MRWSDIPFDPPISTLRWFGVFLAMFAGGLAAWRGLLHEDFMFAGSCLSGALIATGAAILRPSTLRLVFVASMVLAYPINWLVSHLLLAVVFYFIFTPLALVFSLFGRDTLTRRFPTDQDTYWVDKHIPEDIRSYLRQS